MTSFHRPRIGIKLPISNELVFMNTNLEHASINSKNPSSFARAAMAIFDFIIVKLLTTRPVSMAVWPISIWYWRVWTLIESTSEQEACLRWEDDRPNFLSHWAITKADYFKKRMAWKPPRDQQQVHIRRRWTPANNVQSPWDFASPPTIEFSTLSVYFLLEIDRVCETITNKRKRVEELQNHSVTICEDTSTKETET